MKRITSNTLIEVCRSGELLLPEATTKYTYPVMRAFFGNVLKYFRAQSGIITAEEMTSGVYGYLMQIDDNIKGVADCFVAFIDMYNRSEQVRVTFLENVVSSNYLAIAKQMFAAKTMSDVKNDLGIGGAYHSLPIAIYHTFKVGWGKQPYNDIKILLSEFCKKHRIYMKSNDVVIDYKTPLCKTIELNRTIGVHQVLYNLFILSKCDNENCIKVFKELDDYFMNYQVSDKFTNTNVFVTFLVKQFSILGYN